MPSLPSRGSSRSRTPRIGSGCARRGRPSRGRTLDPWATAGHREVRVRTASSRPRSALKALAPGLVVSKRVVIDSIAPLRQPFVVRLPHRCHSSPFPTLAERTDPPLAMSGSLGQTLGRGLLPCWRRCPGKGPDRPRRCETSARAGRRRRARTSSAAAAVRPFVPRSLRNSTDGSNETTCSQ